MEIYVIPPLGYLELMNLGSRYFCLAQLYRSNEEYRKFFRDLVAAGKWVTLDNGTGDHDAISQNELFELTMDLMPSEVIPLDTLFDRRETIKNTLHFINMLDRAHLKKQIEIFACPQGASFDEWIDCYKTLSNIPAVHTIGMSKLAIPWVVSGSTKDKNIARDRNAMFDYLQNNGLLKKQLHFLGAGEPWEFQHYKDSPYVRSTDSCFTILSAINNVSLQQDFKRIPTPRDYFQCVMTDVQIDLALENIKYFKGVCSLL